MRLAIFLLAAFFAGVSGIPLNPAVVMTGPFGTISSPNYPNEYANNVEKEWEIQVRQGYHIKFRFTSFDLEDSYEIEHGPCVYDYVLVTEGSKTIGKFCGNAEEYPWDAPRTNDWFYTKGSETRLLFVSDYSNEGITPTGFSAHYVEVDNDECADMRYKVQNTLEDWDELIVCDHFCNNVPGSYYCSCRSGYTLHSNRHTCVAIADCVNQKLTAENGGVIESPEYPNAYAKLSHCSWDIEVPDGLSIHLKFDSEFDVEAHDVEGCVYDILEVNNGTKETYCGTTAPNNGLDMDMNNKHVVISFKTDLSVEKSGFRITYNTTKIRCKQPLSNPTNGSIMTPNPKGYYEFRDVVLFACDIGYDLEGESRLKCLSDGSWDHVQPRCNIISCGPPEHLKAIKYSHILDLGEKRFKYQEKITVECDDWYEMTVGSAIWNCSHTKKWVRHSVPIAPNPPDDHPKCRPKCGARLVQENAIEAQLSGAKRVKRHGGWPWMAFVDLGGTRTGKRYCGGALVDEMTVVTAAHCIFPLNDDDDVTVWVGFLNRKTENFNFTQSFRVPFDKRFYHNSYSGTDRAENFGYDGDVAVLKLDRPAEFSYFVHPICVPNAVEQARISSQLSLNNKKAVVTGWGRDEKGNFSTHLMKIRIPLVNHDTCVERFDQIMGRRDLITENMICAGYGHGSVDACQGDSGGPLMSLDQAGDKWYLSGVVSFADNNICGGSNAYGVYTDVSRYNGFLTSHMER